MDRDSMNSAVALLVTVTFIILAIASIPEADSSEDAFTFCLISPVSGFVVWIILQRFNIPIMDPIKRFEYILPRQNVILGLSSRVALRKLYYDANIDGQRHMMEVWNNRLSETYQNDSNFEGDIHALVEICNEPSIKMIISRIDLKYAREKLEMIGKYDTIKIKRKLVVNLLLETLGDKNYHYKNSEKLEEDKSSGQEEVARLLVKIGTKDATVSTKPLKDWLIKTLACEKRLKRKEEYAEVLGEIGGKEAGDVLIMVLKSTKNDNLKETVIKALVKIDDEYALDLRVVEERKKLTERKTAQKREEEETRRAFSDIYDLLNDKDASKTNDWIDYAHVLTNARCSVCGDNMEGGPGGRRKWFCPRCSQWFDTNGNAVN